MRIADSGWNVCCFLLSSFCTLYPFQASTSFLCPQCSHATCTLSNPPSLTHPLPGILINTSQITTPLLLSMATLERLFAILLPFRYALVQISTCWAAVRIFNSQHVSQCSRQCRKVNFYFLVTDFFWQI